MHRGAWYADCVGPLLVPASAVADLVRVLDEQDAVDAPDSPTLATPSTSCSSPVPGADPAATTAALDALRDEPRVRVVGAELAWQEGWRDLGLDDVALALEVPRGADHAVAVADVHSALAQGRRVVAKFRTGPTPTWPWPRGGRAGGVPRALRRARGAVQADRRAAPRRARHLSGGRHPGGEPRRAERARRDLGRARRRRSGRGRRAAGRPRRRRARRPRRRVARRHAPPGCARGSPPTGAAPSPTPSASSPTSACSPDPEPPIGSRPTDRPTEGPP